ncbi:hypothetical protein Ahy_B08g091136 [Arachis hypogaea]|uniref:Uncharacterized protein n=1 Tax=Arachis hypogaea TaxID=3818 RepID=A0A444Y1I4_ARAHY|nr:hypothetical protein Ahy_B08g091136 [Arachis hypogaea]
MGSGSIAASSLIKSPSNGYCMKTTDRGNTTRVMEWCACGCHPVLRWFRIDLNLNKLFFVVLVIINGKRWCGWFVWVDTGQDEGAKKPELVSQNDELKLNFAWRFAKLEDDVRSQK